VVTGVSDDETLHREALLIERDLENIKGVDNVIKVDAREPELRVEIDLQALTGYGIGPVHIADTIRAYYQDISAGGIDLGDRRWLVSLQGTSGDVQHLARLPVAGLSGEVLLGEVAHIRRMRERAEQRVFMDDRPGVLLWVTKKSHTNVLQLLGRVQTYIEQRNR